MKVISVQALTSRMTEILRELEESKEEVLVMEGRQVVMKIISYRRESIKNPTNTQEHKAKF